MLISKYENLNKFESSFGHLYFRFCDCPPCGDSRKYDQIIDLSICGIIISCFEFRILSE